MASERGMRIVAELAQVLRIAKQIKVTLHQLRIPERLEAVLVHGEAFSHGSAAVGHQGGGFHGEDLVIRKLLAIVAD